MLNTIPTETEIIHNPKLKKQVLIEIPNTKFDLHGKYSDRNKMWEISIIDPLGGSKRKVFNNVKSKDFRNLIAVVLAHPEQKNFKKAPKMMQLIRHYKSIIKGHRA